MVSILLATFNGAKFLKEQLNSILNQSYKEWVLYIRDDLSTDNTRKIIDEYITKYPNKFIFIDSFVASKSAQNNFFELLANCDGDYIMFCDQDDVWMPEKIEKTLNKMKQIECDYGESTPILVHTDLVVVDENLDIISNSFFKYQNISPNRKSLKNFLVQNNVTGCTVMINKSLHSFVLKRPDTSVMHDWWLALIASSLGIIDYISEPTILYRQHSNNSVGAKDAKSNKYLLDKFKNRDNVIKNYKLMFLQSECFFYNFNEKLSKENYELVENYIKIKNLNKISKIRQIIKYKFYKNTFIRTLGQFISI